jgi:formylglycine-generating enzyme required for sulfatase activity
MPAAPAGVVLQKTRACSVPGRMPWFGVTATEAEQTCNANGGRLCTTAEWQTACGASESCQ